MSNNATPTPNTSSSSSLTQPYQGNWLESLACSILRCGQIPKHVAFIMDGNRRYANKVHIDRIDGHKQGFDTLAKVLSWCRELGITQVSLYAFSIENFKRTEDEVSSLMNIAREKCDSILDELDKVNEAGIRVRVAGDLQLLPEDVRKKIQHIQDMTCNNERAFLNVCLAYTSRHEMVAAVKRLSNVVHQDNQQFVNDCGANGVDSIHGSRLKVEDINLGLFEQNLYLSRPFPDLIIRTSGEVRLSDFMLWQCKESILIFVDALWPEISIWDFMKAIFLFQNHKKFARYLVRPKID